MKMKPINPFLVTKIQIKKIAEKICTQWGIKDYEKESIMYRIILGITGELFFCREFNLLYEQKFIHDQNIDYLIIQKGAGIFSFEIKTSSLPKLTIKKQNLYNLSEVIVAIQIVNEKPKFLGWIEKDEIIENLNRYNIKKRHKWNGIMYEIEPNQLKSIKELKNIFQSHKMIQVINYNFHFVN